MQLRGGTGGDGAAEDEFPSAERHRLFREVAGLQRTANTASDNSHGILCNLVEIHGNLH
jgi:hypothetical protein